MTNATITTREIYYVVVSPCQEVWSGDVLAVARPLLTTWVPVAYKHTDGEMRTKTLYPNTRLYQWASGYKWSPPSGASVNEGVLYLPDASLVTDVVLQSEVRTIDGEKKIYISLPFGKSFVRGTAEEYYRPASPRRYDVTVYSVVGDVKTQKSQVRVDVDAESEVFTPGSGFDACSVEITTVGP